jgi:hypothetical protein
VRLGDAELIASPSAAARGFAAAVFFLGALFFARAVFEVFFLAGMFETSRARSV